MLRNLKRQFGKRLVEAALKCPTLIEDIERITGLRLGPGTLYGAITRLEERGWIKPVQTNDRRRPYTLTASGREYLKAQLEVLERLLKTTARRLKHA